MRLSKNFTLQEMTRSQTALRRNIHNQPSDPVIIDNMKVLCERVLEPVRRAFGPVVINSGYRSPSLNKAIGGATNSQHVSGEAADIEAPGVSNYKLAHWIANNLRFDQLILEFYTPGDETSGWVHVSYTTQRENRMSVLTATKERGKTVYLNGLVR